MKINNIVNLTSLNNYITRQTSDKAPENQPVVSTSALNAKENDNNRVSVLNDQSHNLTNLNLLINQSIHFKVTVGEEVAIEIIDNNTGKILRKIPFDTLEENHGISLINKYV